MHIIRSCVLFVCLAPVLSAGAVRGRVVDADGLPLSHASVTLGSVLTGASQRLESTDAGEFVFPDVAAGGYRLAIAAAGLADQTRRIEVERGQAFDAGDIRLSVAGIQQEVTVVSASRVEELRDDSPSKALVVTRDEIRHTGYERAGEVLSEISGVVTRAPSFGLGRVAGEQIDGIDSRQVLVLQDGLPVAGARGIKEGNIDLNQQGVGRLERIEVVKGAASALYGTDAIGGVINLITREPSDPLDVDASVSGGSLGSADGRLGLGGKWNGLTGFVNLESHRQNSYTLLPNDPSTVGPDEDRQAVTGKLRYAFSPRAALGFSTNAFRVHDRALSSETRLRSNDSTQSYALTGDFLPASTTSLQLRLYATRYDQNSRSNPLGVDGLEGPAFDLANLNERYHRADATLGQQIGSRQYLQTGFEWAQDLYRGVNRLVGGNAGQQITTDDVWLQDRIQPLRNLTVTLGGRYQHHSLYGGHAVPKAGLVYRVNDHLTLRAAYGQGFRAPDLGQLYYRLLHLNYGYQVIGNPTLRPESSQSFSTGATYAAGRWRAGLNLFRNNLRGLIDTYMVCNAFAGQGCSGSALEQLLLQYGVPRSFDYDATGALFFTFIYRNISRAYTEGFDLDGEAALTRRLKLAGAYQYLNARDTLNALPLAGRSRHQGHVRLQYFNPRWGLLANLRGNFFDRWWTDPSSGQWAYGYQVWNLYASKRVTGGVQIFGAIDNLAGSTDPKLRQTPAAFDRGDYGRTFRAGLRYTLPHRE